MPLALLAAIAFQDAALVRDLKPRVEHRYRVKVDSDMGTGFAYRIAFKVVGGKAAESNLEMKLSDYRATFEGHEVKNAKLGAGVLGIGALGLPSGLDISGPQGPFWISLLSLYLPDLKEDGDAPIDKSSVGKGLSLEGKATLSHKDGKATVAIDGSIVREGKSLGKLTVSTKINSDGWPRKSEGTLVSADGTYHFTLDRA